MALADGFLDCLNQTVTVTDLTGATVNSYGELTYASTGVAYSARVQDVEEVVRDKDGREQTAKTVAYLASTGSLDPQWTYQLPDGTTPPVLKMYNAPDLDGTVHHVKIWFGEG